MIGSLLRAYVARVAGAASAYPKVAGEQVRLSIEDYVRTVGV